MARERLESKQLAELRSISLKNEKSNEFMPMFKTLKTQYEGKSPVIYFNRIMEMKEEGEKARKNKNEHIRSAEEFRFEYNTLCHFLIDGCNYLKEKYGGWNHEKYKVALELNYAFEGNGAEDLRVLFELFPQGDKSVSEIISTAQQAYSKSFQIYEQNGEGWDPWSDAREALKKELCESHLRDVRMDAVKYGKLSVPICSVCMNVNKNITESLTRYL